MRNYYIIILGIFLVLNSSIIVFILPSINQIGSLSQSTESLELNEKGELVQIEGDPLFPQKKQGIALQGKKHYINLGCYLCHTQQIKESDLKIKPRRVFGDRINVPRDYIWEERVLLGDVRNGPDLIDYYKELKSPKYIYRHLSGKPKNKSTCQYYSFLFYKNEENYIPTIQAAQLAEYLNSLKLNYDLPEANLTSNE